jgi:hypothetical protein
MPVDMVAAETEDEEYGSEFLLSISVSPATTLVSQQASSGGLTIFLWISSILMEQCLPAVTNL